MSNKIIIKSGNGAPGNGVLSLAELGFDITNKKVYIGHSDGNVLLNPNQTELSDLGVIATATELNCIDGVTGNIQMQLNNKAEKSISQTISLPVTEWSNLSQTISVSGATANNNIIISPSPESYDAYCEAGVRCSAQASGKLTFICLDVPTVALTVNIGILD